MWSRTPAPPVMPFYLQRAIYFIMRGGKKKEVTCPCKAVVSGNKHMVITRDGSRRKSTFSGWRDKLAVGKLAEQPRRILPVPSHPRRAPTWIAFPSKCIAFRTTSAVLYTREYSYTIFPSLFRRPPWVPIDLLLKWLFPDILSKRARSAQCQPLDSGFNPNQSQ